MDVKPAAPEPHDRESFPGFLAAPRVKLGGNDGLAQVGLKTTGLDLFFDDGQNLHFDLEGRLQRVATPNLQFRRGLSHRVLEFRKRSREAGGGFARRRLTPEEADLLVEEANLKTQRVVNAVREFGLQFGPATKDSHDLETAVCSALDRAAQFSLNRARQDSARFRQLYGDIPILPPDQYTSLVLLSTDGCRYNRCTFCSFYQGVPFRRKTLQEFRQHLDDVLEYHGQGLALRRSVFLGQANALQGDRAWREEIFELMNDRLNLPPPQHTTASPDWWQGSTTRFTGITSFLDAFSDAPIHGEEFARLRKLNLRQVYVGMETGDAELLRWLKKPATPDQIRATVEAAKAGDVRVGVIILLGVGGETYFEQHVHKSLQLIHEMPLERGDYVYLSPLVLSPQSSYLREAKSAGIISLTAERLIEQEQLLRKGLTSIKKSKGIYVARYDVEHFFY
jgi:hypothetical protein